MRMEPHILVVEDEPLLGELIADALTDRGFAVEVVPDAAAALRHLRSGAEVDILFTDVDLGNGMDGAALAQIVHEMRPGLQIIYSSGRRSMDDIEAVPGSIFLVKPYSLNQVDAAFTRLVPN